MSNKEKTSYKVQIGTVSIGGGCPVAVQSMTDTDTADAEKTAQQIKLLAEAGSELVRITVNSEEAAAKVPKIRERLSQLNCSVPLIGDFHYNGHQLLSRYQGCAESLDKYRINPGNVGFGNKKDDRFNQMIDIAIKQNKPVRIGVNWGSLDKELSTSLMNKNAKSSSPKTATQILHEALIVSALTSAQAAEKRGLGADKIVISCKVSRVQDLVAVYSQLHERCRYALHLGLTEAGMGSKGIVASSIAMGLLLQQGIGNTLRTSLTPEPGALRTQEVIVSQQILHSLDIRHFAPVVTACPGCGRTTSTFFRELTAEVDTYIRQNMHRWRQEYLGVEKMTLAVMGCIVNGPGESKHANIGISLPGTGEEPSAPVFIDGEKSTTLKGANIGTQFLELIEAYIKKTYPKKNNIIAQV